MHTHKFHYVYRITNTLEKKYYYGCRSTNINPINELGIKYFSSSLDKKFQKDQRINNHNYKYKIIRLFDLRKDAIEFEIYLHNKFNVTTNPKFYNNAKQTSTGFDFSGKPHTEESKQKIANKNRNRIVSEETRSKLSKIAKGRILSQSTKDKMSKPKSEDTKIKMKLNALNRSPELQRKMTEASTGWSHSIETKEKLRGKAINRSLETREKMALANKGKKFYFSILDKKTIYTKEECPIGYLPGRYKDYKNKIDKQ